ncbi:hypothetical protein VIGAN_UM003800, partial [Vigna angularis var. angularis]
LLRGVASSNSRGLIIQQTTTHGLHSFNSLSIGSMRGTLDSKATKVVCIRGERRGWGLGQQPRGAGDSSFFGLEKKATEREENCIFTFLLMEKDVT